VHVEDLAMSAEAAIHLLVERVVDRRVEEGDVVATVLEVEAGTGDLEVADKHASLVRIVVEAVDGRLALSLPHVAGEQDHRNSGRPCPMSPVNKTTGIPADRQTA
jgi:hypothetical protein